MRRFKRLYFVGGVTVLASLAFAAVSVATHGGQTALIKYTANGKSTNKGTPGILDVELANTDDPSTSSPTPPQLNELVVKLDQNITYDGSKFPVCRTSLEGFTADQAQAACGNAAPKTSNALIGTASARVQIGTVVVDAVGLAFNGVNVGRQGGPTEITTFIRADALNVTTVIHCALGKSAAPFKDQFTCPIPPLAGGAGAVTAVDFAFERTETIKKKKKKSATASKKKKKKKKVAALVSAKCPSSGTLTNEATFTYNDHATEVIPSTNPC
jgi:hypothetical protein